MGCRQGTLMCLSLDKFSHLKNIVNIELLEHFRPKLLREKTGTEPLKYEVLF